MKVVVVGATGLVGRVCAEQLLEAGFDIDLVASARSSGKVVFIQGQSYTIYGVDDYDFSGVDVAMLCVRAQVAELLYPRMQSVGCVIDNSSAFRNDVNIPLVVPEIVPNEAYRDAPLISSPNCVAIPLAMLLAVFDRNQPKDIVVTTLQSLSGAGEKALKTQEASKDQITAHIGDIDPWGHCQEELKIKAEVKRLVGYDLSVMTSRVPVAYGHSMHVSFVIENGITRGQALELLGLCPYIECRESEFLPLTDIRGSMQLFVGRVKVEGSRVSMWVASDNLCRGAAGNMLAILKQLPKFVLKEKV